MQLRLAVDIAQRAPGLHGRGPRLGVHEDPAEPRHVHGQARVGQRGAGDVVAAAAHRQQEAVVARKLDGGHDVRRVGRLHDQRRSLVDHAVPEPRRLRETRVHGEEQRAAQALAERVDGLGLIRGGDGHGASVPSAACSARRNAAGCSIGGSSAAFSITCKGHP